MNCNSVVADANDIGVAVSDAFIDVNAVDDTEADNTVVTVLLPMEQNCKCCF